MRAILLAGVIAIAAGGTAYAAPASTHCAAGERVVYSCAFGHKVASVCLAPKTVTYRYGPLGKPEIEIASTGADGHAFQDNVMGSGGSGETMIRFTNNGYSYVIYVETRGALTDHANENNSGIAIYKGTDSNVTLECKHTSSHYLNLELPAFVPKEQQDDDFARYY